MARGGLCPKKLPLNPPNEIEPPPDSSPATEPPQAEGIHGWRRAVLWVLAIPIRLWAQSLRFELSEEDLKNATYSDEPVAIVLWHNRLFLAAEYYRRYRKKRLCYAIISSSKDGAWLDGFFSLFGMAAIRGSSSRQGREAATAMLEVMRSGNDIGITPDGPRGPCYDVKPGTLIVTRRTRSDMILLGGAFDAAWQLKSWDRFYLPKPFSRVRLRCDFLRYTELSRDRDEAARQLHDRLMAINPD